MKPSELASGWTPGKGTMRGLSISSLALLMSLYGRLEAQEVTGNIAGQVLDEVGRPADGARVTLSGNNLLGSRDATTDADGQFTILGLPPGSYTLSIVRIGARPVTIERAVVEVGRVTALRPITLVPQVLELPPILVAADHQLDPTHTDVGGTLSAAEYGALPLDRDYKSIVTLLPHVNESSRGDPANAAGATGLENMYFIDGVNVTSTLDASTGTSLPYNFVRAIEIKTGGYEAQYGNALGAVVNAVTYSGTNEVEGNAFGFLAHSALSADPKAQPTLRETDALSYDAGFRLSGPVERDRIWYSLAYNPRVQQARREIQGHGSFTDKQWAHIFASKVSWKLSPTLDMEFSLFGDPTIHTAVRAPLGTVVPAGYTPLNPDPYLARIETGGVAGSLRTVAILGKQNFLEISVGRNTSRQNETGGTLVAQSEPLLIDHQAGTVSGGNFSSNTSDMGRWSVGLRGTATLGRHVIVAGGGYEDLEATRDILHPGGFWVERDSAGNYITTVESARGEFHNRTPTAFLQDSWQLGEGMTLNLGIRWSAQTLTSGTGKVAQRFTGEWQPRLGVVWQPGKSKADRVFASAGRFYQQEPLGFSSLNYADLSFAVSYYSTDPREPGAAADSTPVTETIYGDSVQSIPGLQPENSDEITLGYERLVGSNTKLTARIIRRDLRSSFQWGFGPDGFVIGTPGKGDFAFLPKPKREYTALELSTEGTWRRVTYRASYVLSRNWGNYPGLYDSDLGITTPGGVRTFIAPWQAVNSTGLLPNDRTHVFKLSASYSAILGISIGAAITWASGSPVNIFAAGPGSIPVFRTFVVQRGSAGRTPSLWDVDLRLSYTGGIARAVDSRLVLDVFNIGNPQHATQVEELRFLSNNSGEFSDENPSYGIPISYQPPMMARLGLELGF
jgi:hypothetical protein